MVFRATIEIFSSLGWDGMGWDGMGGGLPVIIIMEWRLMTNWN